MAIRVQRHTNVSKQARLLDGLDVSPLKWRVCGCGLNRFVHEGLNHISNVKVHLKTRSGNVNIVQYEGCSNMNASSFIIFVTYMLRQNGLRFYEGLYVTFKLAPDLTKNRVY